MATSALSAGLARLFSALTPSTRAIDTNNAIKMSSPQTLPKHKSKMQYESTSPMLAIPPSEVKPKAVLATKQPAIQDATMLSEDLEAERIILTMRGGFEHDHHGTRLCHDACCCFICCDFMDDCCTAIDDVVCCE